MNAHYSVCLPDYTAGADAYLDAAKEAVRYGSRLLLVGGKRALAAGRDKLTAALGADAEIVHTEVFTGHCTDAEALEVADLARAHRADILCGMGGGRVIDTVKAAGEYAGLPVFTFPTIAATCAAVTALSVVYNEDGTFSRLFHLKQPPVHAFIDADILAKSPPKYLRAGMGDSLGKHVETAFCARGSVWTHGDTLGLSIAGGLMASMELHGAAAMEEITAGQGGAALLHMALLNIVSVGCVSLLVREEFNSALAHSLYYSLEGKPGMEDCLHGDVVAWGAAAQLALDGQMDKARSLLQLLRAIGTRCSLKEMGADINSPVILSAIRESEHKPDMSFLPYPISADQILDAVLLVERMAEEV